MFLMRRLWWAICVMLFIVMIYHLWVGSNFGSCSQESSQGKCFLTGSANMGEVALVVPWQLGKGT